MIDQKLKETIKKACLEAAKKMGPNLGKLSWFGKSKEKNELTDYYRPPYDD